MTIYRSHLPSISIPDESIFTHLFTSRFLDFPPSAPAYIDATTGTTLTRSDLREISLSLGYGLRNALADIGGAKLKRGDIVMIFSPNSIAWPVMFYGIIAAGLRATLANSSYVARELEHQWNDSRAKAVFVAPELLPVVLETFKNLGLSEAQARERIVLANWGIFNNQISEYITMRDLLGRGRLHQEEIFAGKLSSETAVLCYSSGTTGKPKGVETTHRNVVSNLNMAHCVFPATSNGDVVLGVLPFYHVYGLVKLVMFTLLRGVPTVVMSRFDPIEFCKNIERYKVTMSLIVPPICLALIHHPASDKFNLKTLRVLFSGAAPLSDAIVKATENKLTSVGAKVAVIQGYGLTETSPVAHLLPVEDHIRKMGSVGVLFPNLEARLVIEDVKDAPSGEAGELWIRGPTVMKGYLNNVEATKDAITPDGWFKTGDIATRDKDGYYFIVDRRKELIKYKGFQVPPAELESVLTQHPDIVDAAVIGVHSEKDATELPRAYVVHAKGLKGGDAVVFGEEVQRWIEPRVAKHKLLRGGVIVIDAVPRSAAGKILRRELRDRAKKEPVPQTAKPKL